MSPWHGVMSPSRRTTAPRNCAVSGAPSSVALPRNTRGAERTVVGGPVVSDFLLSELQPKAATQLMEIAASAARAELIRTGGRVRTRPGRDAGDCRRRR